MAGFLIIKFIKMSNKEKVLQYIKQNDFKDSVDIVMHFNFGAMQTMNLIGELKEEGKIKRLTNHYIAL